ncbi:Glycosyltransferase involved in cell wall bisynthesis [Ruminococcaceae bacterium YAD3003]|nr:Glycosyltransferase involved in cell wall bisynthesis [Ruminococcaceae bacterium YAD3003]
MEQNNKVSIIVPVYNVENYIYECVNSLMHQDYNNIEIILVDDGSPDKSGEILDRLKLLDERIIVVHKLNEGVSSARNAGLKIASGDYLMFVDGDDWVDPNYVSYFLSLVKNNKCMIGINRNNYYVNNSKSSDDISIVTAEKAIEWIYSGDIFVAVWNKIYSSKLVKNNNIFFNQDIWFGEGMLFNIECLQFVDSVVVGEKTVYHQVYNVNSAMRKFNLDSYLCGIRSLDIQRGIWKKRTNDIEREWLFHRFMYNRYIIVGLVETNTLKEHASIYKECVRNIRKNMTLVVKREKSFKHKIGWICFCIFPRLMAKREIRIKMRFVGET